MHLHMIFLLKSAVMLTLVSREDYGHNIKKVHGYNYSGLSIKNTIDIFLHFYAKTSLYCGPCR